MHSQKTEGIMIKLFKKGEGVQLSTHFNSKNFDCKCLRGECDQTLVCVELIAALETLSKLFGSLQINSGYRCLAHNKEIGGEPGSFHMKGMAADVVPMFAPIKEFALVANEMVEFANSGMGLYNKFVHLDIRDGRARWGDLSLLETHGKING